MPTPHHDGYIALITVILLSAIMLALVASISTETYVNQTSGLSSHTKELSYFVAYSCIDRAILKLRDNWSYGGNESFTIDSYRCTIAQIETIGGNKKITATATVDSSQSKLVTTIDSSLTIISFEEQ